MKRLALHLLAMMALLTGCQPHPQEKTVPVATSPGQQLFLSHCVSCHMGAGDPPGPNATVLDSATLRSEMVFREQVRHPASAMMRSFSEQELSDAQLHELYVYLQMAKTPLKRS